MSEALAAKPELSQEPLPPVPGPDARGSVSFGRMIHTERRRLPNGYDPYVGSGDHQRPDGVIVDARYPDRVRVESITDQVKSVTDQNGRRLIEDHFFPQYPGKEIVDYTGMAFTQGGLTCLVESCAPVQLPETTEKGEKITPHAGGYVKNTHPRRSADHGPASFTPIGNMEEERQVGKRRWALPWRGGKEGNHKVLNFRAVDQGVNLKETKEIKLKIYNKDGSYRTTRILHGEADLDRFMRGEPDHDEDKHYGDPIVPADQVWWTSPEVDRDTVKVSVPVSVNPDEAKKKAVIDGRNRAQIGENRGGVLSAAEAIAKEQELGDLENLTWQKGGNTYTIIGDDKKSRRDQDRRKVVRTITIRENNGRSRQITLETLRKELDSLSPDQRRQLNMHFNVPRVRNLSEADPIPTTPEQRALQLEALEKIAEETLGHIYPPLPPRPKDKKLSGYTGRLTELQLKERKEQREAAKKHIGRTLFYSTPVFVPSSIARGGSPFRVLSTKERERRADQLFNDIYNDNNLPGSPKKHTPEKAAREKEERIALFLLTSAENPDLSDEDRAERVRILLGQPEEKAHQESIIANEAAFKKLVMKQVEDGDILPQKGKAALEDYAERVHRAHEALDDWGEGRKKIDQVKRLIKDKGLPEVVDMALRMQRDLDRHLEALDLLPVDLQKPEMRKHPEMRFVIERMAEQYHITRMANPPNQLRPTPGQNEIDPGVKRGDLFAETREGRDLRRSLVNRRIGEEFYKAGGGMNMGAEGPIEGRLAGLSSKTGNKIRNTIRDRARNDEEIQNVDLEAIGAALREELGYFDPVQPEPDRDDYEARSKYERERARA